MRFDAGTPRIVGQRSTNHSHFRLHNSIWWTAQSWTINDGSYEVFLYTKEEADLHQQHNKSSLFRCIVVCNPMNHMAEKTQGSFSSRNTVINHSH
jgi:hypothetical protein